MWLDWTTYECYVVVERHMTQRLLVDNTCKYGLYSLSGAHLFLGVLVSYWLHETLHKLGVVDGLTPNGATDRQRTIAYLTLTWHYDSRESIPLDCFLIFFLILLLCLFILLIFTLLLILFSFSCFDISLYDLLNLSALILEPMWLTVYTLVYWAIL